MHRSKLLGYFAYPILAVTFLFTPGAVSISLAQSTSQPTQAEPTPPQSSSQTASSSQAGSSPQSASARIRARRQQRIAQAIHEIYDHKYEAFGGGGYLRFQPGSSLQKTNEVLWNVAITDYLKPRLGVTADFRGLYGTAYTYNNPVAAHYSPSIYQYTWLVGPQYRVHSGPHYAVSARILAGSSYGNFDSNFNGTPSASFLGLYSNTSALAVNVGVPLDYNVSPALGLRLTPEYFLTRFGGEFQQNRGLSLGVIYRFGKR